MKKIKRATALLLCFVLIGTGLKKTYATESVSSNDVSVETTAASEPVADTEAVTESTAETIDEPMVTNNQNEDSSEVAEKFTHSAHNVGSINMEIDAPDDAFPEGTVSEVTEVNAANYQSAANELLQTVNPDLDILGMTAMDISFTSDGEEV